MGLFDQAREAAENAAGRARTAAERAAERASEAAERATGQARAGSNQAGDKLRVAAGQARVAANQAAVAVADPANQASAKDAARRSLSKAKSGVANALDRIDPGLLADIVIKATALQERANRSLREKNSPYRINEITITAGLPPDVAFTIGRIDVMEEALPTLQPSSAAQAPLVISPGEATGESAGEATTEQATTETTEAAEPTEAADVAGVEVLLAD